MGLVAVLLSGGAGIAQDRASLARQAANPIADLTSIPFQYDYDDGFGPSDGSRGSITIEPVIPFSFNDDWMVISRTSFPVISQDDVIPGRGSQFGTGATTQSFFFTPKSSGAGGLSWGAGPSFLLPTGTDGLASNQWGAGVTGAVVLNAGPWTMGGLANHLWSLTGESRHGGISDTYVEPFLTYTTPGATSFTVNTEATYDWNDSQWSVPINATVSQVMTMDGQAIQIGGGVRYWAESPDGGAEGWGGRLLLSFLFPPR